MALTTQDSQFQPDSGVQPAVYVDLPAEDWVGLKTSDLSSSASWKRCSRGDECVHPDGPWLPRTSEFFRARKGRSADGLRSECKHCSLADAKKYIDANREKVNLACVRRRAANVEHHREQERKWNAAHSASRRQTTKKWYRANPEKVRLMRQKRRTAKRHLPFTFTAEDWQCALGWWRGVCAYCGKPQGLLAHTKLCQDHFIPLAHQETCPGTVPQNILPACMSCNSSKGDSDPIEWLKQAYKEGRLGKQTPDALLKRIHEYFDHVSGLHASQLAGVQ